MAYFLRGFEGIRSPIFPTLPQCSPWGLQGTQTSSYTCRRPAKGFPISFLSGSNLGTSGPTPEPWQNVPRTSLFYEQRYVLMPYLVGRSNHLDACSSQKATGTAQGYLYSSGVLITLEQSQFALTLLVKIAPYHNPTVSFLTLWKNILLPAEVMAVEIKVIWTVQIEFYLIWVNYLRPKRLFPSDMLLSLLNPLFYMTLRHVMLGVRLSVVEELTTIQNSPHGAHSDWEIHFISKSPRKSAFFS